MNSSQCIATDKTCSGCIQRFGTPPWLHNHNFFLFIHASYWDHVSDRHCEVCDGSYQSFLRYIFHYHVSSTIVYKLQSFHGFNEINDLHWLLVKKCQECIVEVVITCKQCFWIFRFICSYANLMVGLTGDKPWTWLHLQQLACTSLHVFVQPYYVVPGRWQACRQWYSSNELLPSFPW